MSFIIYKDGKEHFPLKRFEKITDDYGIKWQAKMGEQKEPHFALVPGQDIYKEDSEPITEWHLSWQELFKQKGFSLEVVRVRNKQYRRADILCEKRKVVVEIQHSPISGEDIKARTNFWREEGYQVVWIFSKEFFEKGAQQKLSGQKMDDYVWQLHNCEYDFEIDRLKFNTEKDRLKQMHYSTKPKYILADVNACFLFNTKHNNIMCMYIPNSYFFKEGKRNFKHSLRFELRHRDDIVKDIEAIKK